ncbi:MAG: ABC transporter substrate-binding protein [Syntrophales bacterium]|jgi:branched-chain amino acid transport system substrate-binding protein|nr:ABC transporter substrate-binding protein [Syntrophales bacterium]
MKIMTLGWRLALTCCIVMVMCFPAWGRTIKIGVIGPMQFVQGKGHWAGATMAADEINARGGVQVGGEKMKIELIKADSNEFINVADATNAMERLMTQDKVDFVVGGFRTEAVFPMQDIAMDYKKIFIDCGAATTALCTRVAENYNRYKYFFRQTPFNDIYLVRTSFAHLAMAAAVMKKELNVPIKCAIVAEKAAWTDGMIKAAQATIPKLGMELVGTWQPSDKATDVTAELSAIQKSGANVVFTIFSASVGITFARQAGELKIPAAQVGINVEAQKDGFWEATKGMGNYVFTTNTYCRGVEYNELTTPFMDKFIKRFNETPTYTAGGTHDAILYALVPSIEAVGSLDADKIVAHLENREYKVPSGIVKYEKTKDGKPTHDLTWGPGYLTSLGVQWQDGKLVGVWPNKWKLAPDGPEATYKGIVPMKLPPWLKK